MTNSGKTSYSAGRLAESAAADYLTNQGYKILDQNWRTKWCEIDLVASLDNVVYFVEVKYRATNTSGNGLDYITESKLRQMARAAESWISVHSWGGDYQLSAVELYGPKYDVNIFIKDIY